MSHDELRDLQRELDATPDTKANAVHRDNLAHEIAELAKNEEGHGCAPDCPECVQVRENAEDGGPF